MGFFPYSQLRGSQIWYAEIPHSRALSLEKEKKKKHNNIYILSFPSLEIAVYI